MIAALWQLAIVWTATCGSVQPTMGSRVTYTAPLTGRGPCVVTASAGGRSASATVTLASADIVGGIAMGLSQWPLAMYGQSPITGAMQPVTLDSALRYVQTAAQRGVRLFLVPPRRYLTATGKGTGLFVLDSAKRYTDRLALVLPPDTLAKYRATLLGMNLADDYLAVDSWGGVAVTQLQIAAWAAYAGGKLPGLPLGIRVTPDWAAKEPLLVPLLDYAWAQYHTKKGTQADYYGQAATLAASLGLRLVVGVNVEDCAGGSTPPCTPGELLNYGTMALRHPASCAFVNWRYDEATFADSAVRAAWDSLGRLAQTVPSRECRR